MQSVDESDLTDYLPSEIILEIFCYLDVQDIGSASLVCKRWNAIIKSEILWRQQCDRVCDRDNVNDDRQLGHSWKDTFRLNFGVNALKKKWKQGHFSQPKSYQDLPSRVMCKMEAEEWGWILQSELER